ncbi:hypothetical protein [Acidovorax sp. SUPP2825]|uniref:hypothetical protein n=1 Tax=Acidovorax sp. SUPP2825 TaxID=2920879 RepID=UPI0023DE4394|nr:hypothetical protein [Acidovorax sp. SUPP2825]GKS97629.1 hypothetical protein AVAK2825_23860 [Acidovorax sp. SUPP2825]
MPRSLGGEQAQRLSEGVQQDTGHSVQRRGDAVKAAPKATIQALCDRANFGWGAKFRRLSRNGERLPEASGMSIFSDSLNGFAGVVQGRSGRAIRRTALHSESATRQQSGLLRQAPAERHSFCRTAIRQRPASHFQPS